MTRRIAAWILLCGFIFLIANMLFIHYLATVSAVLYAAIIAAYVFMSISKRRELPEIEFDIGYGKDRMKFHVDPGNMLAEVRSNDVKTELSGVEELKRALDEPIGACRLEELAGPGEKIAIITSDITRPMPTRLVLPEVVKRLADGGVKYEDITVILALGSHRKHSEDERKYLVGDTLYGKIRCIDSDPNDCVHMGTTERGTPVDIFSAAARADKRICLGNIEYHYFAGYSGGAKAIMPGISSRAAIQANHSRMVSDSSCAGVIEGNPVREDIDEAARFISVDYIVNVVLNEKKEIIKAVAGHYIKAHREGCRFLDTLYKVGIPYKADIVITTPGGYPKDINLYQSQKALDNAKNAVREGGIIILAASCSEGLGEKTFERWINEAESPDELISRAENAFELGGHKAAAIALVLKKAGIYLVSDLDEALVRKMYMEPFKSVDDALGRAYERLGSQAKVLVMPFGGSTLPVMAR